MKIFFLNVCFVLVFDRADCQGICDFKVIRNWFLETPESYINVKAKVSFCSEHLTFIKALISVEYDN